MATVRRLTAILADDVAGYSRLMGADEEGTHERLNEHLRDLIKPKIAEHRGQVVKNTPKACCKGPRQGGDRAAAGCRRPVSLPDAGRGGAGMRGAEEPAKGASGFTCIANCTGGQND